MRLLSISCGFRPLFRFRDARAHFEMMIYSNGLRTCCAKRAYSNDRATPHAWAAALSGVAVETDDATGLALRIAPVRAGGRLEPAVPWFWANAG